MRTEQDLGLDDSQRKMTDRCFIAGSELLNKDDLVTNDVCFDRSVSDSFCFHDKR